MKRITIKIGGTEYQAAPLKPLQAAELIDEFAARKDDETVVQIYTRSLRTIARSLNNAGEFHISGGSEDDVIEKINNEAEHGEIELAFIAILEVSGLSADPAPAGLGTAPQLAIAG